MQVLMTPLLYKDMEIDVERLDQDLFATLEEDHLGLPHVQTLRISMEDGAHADEGMSDLQAHVVCRLLNAIPRNSLTRIEYDTTYSSDKNKQRLTCVLESQTHALVCRNTLCCSSSPDESPQLPTFSLLACSTL